MPASKKVPRSALLRQRAGKSSNDGKQGDVKKKRKKHRKERLRLKRQDKKKLKKLMKRGWESVRVFKRAQVLQLLHAGESAAEVAKVLGCATSVVYRAKWLYLDGGLDRALQDAPRPGQVPVFTDKHKQQVVAMVCGPAPEGLDRWTIRLIAEEAVNRAIVPKMGRETARIILKGHDLKPWREKNVVCSGADAGIRGEDGGLAESLCETDQPQGTGRMSG